MPKQQIKDRVPVRDAHNLPEEIGKCGKRRQEPHLSGKGKAKQENPDAESEKGGGNQYRVGTWITPIHCLSLYINKVRVHCGIHGKPARYHEMAELVDKEEWEKQKKIDLFKRFFEIHACPY